jgi:hypothetical protein
MSYLKNLKLQVSQYQLILQMINYSFELQEQGVMKLQYLVPLVKQSSVHFTAAIRKTNMTINDEMNVDINTNTDLETMTNLLPSVVETLKKKGKIVTWIKFKHLLSTDAFPLDNIAFFCFWM